MKKYLILIIVLTFLSCKSNYTKEEFSATGKLISIRTFKNKKDTLNYVKENFYPTGEILRRMTIKDGKPEGDYLIFSRSGILISKKSYLNGLLNGITQRWDTSGTLLEECYYLRNRLILYSKTYTSYNGVFQKQVFHIINKDTLYAIGSIVKKGNDIQEAMSDYAIIIGDDTCFNENYKFGVNIFPPEDKNLHYEITFGNPDENLRFSKPDTSYISSEHKKNLLRVKLIRGLNHLFGRIYVFNKDSILKSYFVYKDVYYKSLK